MRVIHLCRKPLSEASVAANVVKHGVGGLNIDGSRVQVQAWDQKSEGGRNTGHKDQRGRQLAFALSAGNPDDGKGRWPANVILQHLDGCRCEGVKRVKGSPKPYVRGVASGNVSAYSKGIGDKKGDLSHNYADTDGNETIANWVCEPGCPVAALDEQSGTLTSGKPSGTRNRDSTMFGQARGNGAALTGFGDKGGASRFFKQVGDSHE